MPRSQKNRMSAKVMGLLGLTAMLTAGACVSTSVIAVNVRKESACRGSSGGASAYRWAWSTAVAGGITSGACIAGIILMLAA